MTRLRSRYPVLLSALLVTAACSGGATQSSGSTGTGATLPSTSTSVSMTPSVPAISKQTRLLPSILASVSLDSGALPTGIVAGFGSIWVTQREGTSLYRVDPATDEVIAKVVLPGGACGVPVAGAGRIWVTPCASGGIMVVNPATDTLLGMVPDTGCCMMALTPGSLWSPDGPTGALERYSTRSYKRLHTFPGSVIGPVATLGGLVWVAPQESGSTGWGRTVNGVDPRTNEVVKRITVPDPGRDTFMTAGFGRLWLKSPANDRLISVDPASATVTTFHLAPFTPMTDSDTPVAVGLGSLWARTADDRISRIDPWTGKVTNTYPADPTGGGGDVALGFGSLWVVNGRSATVWRLTIGR